MVVDAGSNCTNVISSHSPHHAAPPARRARRRASTAAQNIGESIRTSARTYVCFPSDQERRMPSSSCTLRTGQSGLRAGIVARAKCSTLQGEHQRSGENQARATVSDRSTSDGEWRRDVKVGRGGERLQGASPVKAGGPVLLGEASSWQPLGIRPAPPLGNARLLETVAYVSGNGNRMCSDVLRSPSVATAAIPAEKEPKHPFRQATVNVPGPTPGLVRPTRSIPLLSPHQGVPPPRTVRRRQALCFAGLPG